MRACSPLIFAAFVITLAPSLALACRCTPDANKALGEAPEKALVFMLGEVLGDRPPLTFRPTEVWRGESKDIKFGGTSSCDHRVAEKKKYVLIAKGPEGIFLCNSLIIPEAEAAFYIAKGRALLKKDDVVPKHLRSDFPPLPDEWRRCKVDSDCANMSLGCRATTHYYNRAFQAQMRAYHEREVGKYDFKDCVGVRAKVGGLPRCERGTCESMKYPDESECTLFAMIWENSATKERKNEKDYSLEASGEAECLEECERQYQRLKRLDAAMIYGTKCTFAGRALPMP